MKVQRNTATQLCMYGFRKVIAELPSLLVKKFETQKQCKTGTSKWSVHAELRIMWNKNKWIFWKLHTTAKLEAFVDRKLSDKYKCRCYISITQWKDSGWFPQRLQAFCWPSGRVSRAECYILLDLTSAATLGESHGKILKNPVIRTRSLCHTAGSTEGENTYTMKCVDEQTMILPRRRRCGACDVSEPVKSPPGWIADFKQSRRLQPSREDPQIPLRVVFLLRRMRMSR